MRCKANNCRRETINERNYCDEHLCNHDPGRCKNKRAGRKFCKYHSKPKFKLLKNPVISLVIGIILMLIGFILGALYGEDLSRWHKGYKIRIDILEQKEDLFVKEGKNFTVVEVQNIGGYDLHDVKGQLKFFCRNKDLKDFGTAKLEGPIKTLTYNSEPKSILFDNETLVRYIQSGIGDCFDAIIEVIHPTKVNESTAEIKEIEIWGYDLETDSFSKEIKEGNVTSLKLCVYCEMNVTIETNETNFSHSEGKRFSKVSQFFSYPIFPAYTSDYTLTRTTVISSAFKNFSNDAKMFKDYLQKKLATENLTYLSNPILEEEQKAGGPCTIKLPPINTRDPIECK